MLTAKRLSLRECTGMCNKWNVLVNVLENCCQNNYQKNTRLYIRSTDCWVGGTRTFVDCGKHLRRSIAPIEWTQLYSTRHYAKYPIRYTVWHMNCSISISIMWKGTSIQNMRDNCNAMTRHDTIRNDTMNKKCGTLSEVRFELSASCIKILSRTWRQSKLAGNRYREWRQPVVHAPKPPNISCDA